MYHTPVLLEPILHGLALFPGSRVIDATLGDGGHAAALLAATAPDGQLLGLDVSPKSLERATARLSQFGSRVTVARANFSSIDEVARRSGFSEVDAILFDLGVASWQFDEPGLGLSFQRTEELDMRLDPALPETALALIRRLRDDELANILYRFGNIRRSRSIAARIREAARAGRLSSTDALVAAVGTRSPKLLAPVFQALRMAVNDELSVLDTGLHGAYTCLGAGGRLAVISYHSGEDRIVKHLFRSWVAAGHARLITKKAIQADRAERRQNPRSRSAKLRIIEKLSEHFPKP